MRTAATIGEDKKRPTFDDAVRIAEDILAQIEIDRRQANTATMPGLFGAVVAAQQVRDALVERRGK